jgi:tRNA A37 threonylcarbamoyladenosine synthetase subunit TsaC/SUA5/YrdC
LNETNSDKNNNKTFMNDSILGEINENIGVEREQQEVKQEVCQIAIKNQERLEKMKKFWPALKTFIIKDRKPVLQE